METLNVDDKWAVRYDPDNNDKPVSWVRHGKLHSDWEGNNADMAMFYALLDAKRDARTQTAQPDPAQAYAHAGPDGSIDANTLSSTPRAAKVNALVTQAGVAVYNVSVDQQVAEQYERHLGVHGCSIVPVTIIRQGA